MRWPWKRTTKRTWYRAKSDGTFFRNCPLIAAERDEALRRMQFRRCSELGREWDECFRQGVIKTEEIGRRDRWIDFDDSREATARWVERFLAEHGPSPVTISVIAPPAP